MIILLPVVSEVVSSLVVNGVGGRLFTINRVMERRVSNQPQPHLSIIHRGVEYEYTDATFVSDLSNIQSIIIRSFLLSEEEKFMLLSIPEGGKADEKAVVVY